MNTIVLDKIPNSFKQTDSLPLTDWAFDCELPEVFIFNEFWIDFPATANKRLRAFVRFNEEGSIDYLMEAYDFKFIWFNLSSHELVFCPENLEMCPVEGKYGTEYEIGAIRIKRGDGGDRGDYRDDIEQIKDLIDETPYCYYIWLATGSAICQAMSEIMVSSMNRHKLIKKGIPQKHKYSRAHRLSLERQKIWLFDDIVQYTCDQFIEHKGTHKIECPCWEVRGHYRHYKNGHVVFIRSYKKGKQKDTAQPISKEYIAGQRKVVTQ